MRSFFVLVFILSEITWSFAAPISSNDTTIYNDDGSWTDWSPWSGNCTVDGVCQVNLTVTRTRSRLCDTQGGCYENCKAVRVCAETKECEAITTTVATPSTSANPSTNSSELDTCLNELNVCKTEMTSTKQELEKCEAHPSVETTTATSSTSENPSSTESSGPQKTVVIGGLTDSGATADVEILLGESTTNCVVSDYPFPISSPSAVLYDGKIAVCGGYDGSVNQNSCYQLNSLNNSWMEMPPMTHGRSKFGAVVTPYGLMVTGGRASSGWIDTVEYFNGTAWQSGPSMPAAIQYHCAVQLNSTHTAVIGGEGSNYQARSNVYVFDWTQQQWSEVQSMQVARFGHSCVMLPNGNVLVVGGYVANALTPELYDPMADVWMFGPSLPFTTPHAYGALVLVDEKPTLVGGYVEKSRDGRVFQLVDQKWVQLETTLQIARSFHTATQVPVESLPGCTEN